ncbi:hypothetical protein CHS0354_020549 [Potamilus streckersoni]|uniref:DDE-1 domain-containing protein n=1 Tax=Potamilus streckersoni TaxID=2493646 RepID=A0AAE0SNH2_9BIVA|nr:hypothetical protein CHS0354_020549 [Potamilus streckersoni]
MILNTEEMRTKQACPEKVSSKYRRYSQTDMLNAYKAVKEQKMPTYRAALKFKVPETTLRQRVSGEVSVETVSSGPPPLLSREEEAIFVEHMKLILKAGNKCTRAEFLRLATEYAVSLHKKDRDHPFSLKWYRSFIQRWPGLDFISKPGSYFKKMIKTSVKTKNAVPEMTYRDIDQILGKYNLLDKPHHIYNFDHRVLQTEHVSLDLSSCRTCTSIPATSSSAVATVICCGNALGTMIPPYFIFQGYRMKKDFLSGCSTGAGGVVTENGLLNDHVFQNYLKKHFLSYIHSRDSGQAILLLYSGHKLDISSSVINWAIKQYKVILYLLPAQTVQPLDHDCFGPFQHMYNTECHEFLHRFPSVKITTMNVGTMACKAYLHAFSPINLQSSFRKAGIYPFHLSAFDARPSDSEESNQSYEESDKSNEENEGNSDSEPYSKACDELSNTLAQKRHKRQKEKKAKKLRDSAIITKSGDRIIFGISEQETERQSDISVLQSTIDSGVLTVDYSEDIAQEITI